MKINRNNGQEKERNHAPPSRAGTLRCDVPARPGGMECRESTNTPIPAARSGMMLIECLVYIAVFLILSGVAMTAFYVCWDGTHTMIAATEDITAALKAGERWRADVRAATGTIRVATNASGEVVKIPERGQEIIYRFERGQLLRQTAVLVPKVEASEMKMKMRGGVRAWRWELELAPRKKNIHMPFLFTFEAAQGTS